MAKEKVGAADQDISAHKAELAALKREEPTLKRQLASASQGGADPRVNKLIEVLKCYGSDYQKAQNILSNI